MHSALGLVIPLSSEHLMEALNDKLRFLPHVADASRGRDAEGGGVVGGRTVSCVQRVLSDAGHLGAFRFEFAQQEISIFVLTGEYKGERATQDDE